MAGAFHSKFLVLPVRSEKCALIACALAGLASFAAGQHRAWARQFGSDAEDLDLLTRAGAAADGAEGVYLVGTTRGALGGPFLGGTCDAWLAHLDGTGQMLWVRQLGTDEFDNGTDAAPDGVGGVFATGWTLGDLVQPNGGFTDAWVARYDAAGGQQWIRQLSSSDGGDDQGNAAAADGLGGVFLSGATSGTLAGTAAGQLDAWVARYDAAGNLLWTQQIGSSAVDISEAAASDGAGGVFICGRSDGDLGGTPAGSADAWIARFDGQGNLLWTRKVATPGLDQATALQSDGQGGAFVAGSTNGSLALPNPTFFLDAWLARLDAQGNVLWLRQFGTGQFETATALAPDGSGGVYVCGESGGPLGAPTTGPSSPFVVRFDAQGTRLWTHKFGTAAGDRLDAAASDGAQGLYVSGATGGALVGPVLGGSDAWVVRYTFP